jgi:hypothetical protein
VAREGILTSVTNQTLIIQPIKFPGLQIPSVIYVYGVRKKREPGYYTRSEGRLQETSVELTETAAGLPDVFGGTLVVFEMNSIWFIYFSRLQKVATCTI